MPPRDLSSVMSQPPPPSPESDRLRRLEEALGFADHRADQLDEQVRALSVRLREALDRVAALEGRLRALADSADSTPDPPAPSDQE